MESELGIVLREQQAVLSYLLSRVALAQGDARRLAFAALARALYAHLSVLRSILLPKVGDTEFSRQIAAGGRILAEIVAKTIVEQRGVGTNNDIQTLMSSVLSLLSQESTLSDTTLGALSPQAQRMLAVEAEEEFIRLVGPYDLEDLPAHVDGFQ